MLSHARIVLVDDQPEEALELSHGKVRNISLPRSTYMRRNSSHEL